MIFNMYTKRLMAIVLSLFTVLSMMTGYVFAEDEPVTQLSEDTKTAIQLLEALDIIQDSDSFLPTEEITRGYFTALASRALTVHNSSANVRTMFRDVAADYKWANEIAGMYEAGYISGGDDRKFRPEDKITFCEAATIAVTCLGYGQQAQKKGDWPSGYLSEAGRHKLLSGKGVNETLTYGEGVLMIKNMLEAEAVIPSGTFTGGNIVYTKEKNLLSILHNVYTIDGIVTENGITGLYSKESPENSISVGNIRIKNTTGEDTRELLGMYVKLYCRENDDEYEYLVTQSTYRNTVYSMNGWDSGVQYDRNSNSIKYDYRNKTKTLKLSSEFSFIYNGKLEDDYLKYTADFSESTVRVIDNNGDGLFDVLIAETYNTFVSDNVGTASTKLVSKYPGFDAICPDDYDKVEFIDMNGSRLDISDISRGDVISWYASTDKSYAKIIKSGLSVNGEISGTVSGFVTGENEYIIDGKYYKAAPTVKSGAVPISNGKKGTFGLDIFGRIAEFSKDIDTSEGFGLMIRYRKGGDFFETIYVKILNEYNEIRTYTFAEKTKINGKPYKSTENDELYTAIEKMAKKNDSEYAEKEDVVKFKVDDDGKIKSIDFAKGGIPSKDEVEDGSLYMYKQRAKRWYKEDTGNMNDEFILSKASTVVFGIDENFPYGDDDRYFVMSGAAFGNDVEIEAEAYTTKKDPDTAEAIVYYGLPAGSELKFFAINKIYETVNDDYDIVYMAKGFTQQGDMEMEIDPDLVKKHSLSKGDIVGGTTKVDAKGMLYDAELLYDYDGKDMVKNLVGDGFFFHERAFMIYPYSYSGNVIKWFMATSREEAEAQLSNSVIRENDLRNTIVPSGAIYVADSNKSGGIYKKGSMSDIIGYVQDPKNYSDVIVCSKWGNTQAIIIINDRGE